MSNTKYIEIDSTYRNRNEWPLPGEFEVLISQSGRKGKENAMDPVSIQTPVFCWTSNRVDANTSGIQLTGVIDSIGGLNNIAASNDNNTFIITSAAGNLQQLNNYYNALILKNTTISEQRRIIGYQYLGTDTGGTNDRGLITVNTSFGSSFANGNSFSINDPTDISNTSYPLFFVPDGRVGTDSYKSYLLYNETRNEYRVITNYDLTTHLLSIDTTSPVTTWTITDNYCIRKQIPLSFFTIAGGTTINNVVLSVGASTENDFYNNQFIRIRATTYGNSLTSPEGEIRRITDYDGSTLTISVSPPFSLVPTIGNIVEILDFSYDNLNPFVYTGSQVSQQEMVCYEIELLNLILPNKTLSSGFGSRIAFYPYIYVELSNVSGASAGNKNLIYSNNPNATSMIFRVPIDDVPNPIITSFIKVDGDSMVQTIKFKPNDNLRFSVKLSNGQIYQTVDQEYYSPSPPNSEIQISALFAVRRL